jgi:hypothetical protein
VLVIVVSVFLSMKQDKVNENEKLTTEMFNCENLVLAKYVQDEWIGIKIIDGEIKNIR